MEILTTLSAAQKRNKGEVHNLPSETVEGQAPALREVLKRYVMGVAMPLGKKMYHDGLESFDDVDPTLAPDFDLVDAQILADDIDERQTKLKKLKSELETKTAKLKDEAKKKEAEQKLREQIKLELKKSETPKA